MKKKHKIAVIFILIFVFIFLVIASLPIVISSTQGRSFALRQINQRISGELMVASWSLRWLGNITIEQLAFNDVNGERLFDLSKASISRGLLDLITDHNDFGEIKLVKPLVSVAPYIKEKISANDGASEVETVREGAKNRGNKTSETEKKPSAKDKFVMPHIRGTVSIEDGTVQMLSSNGTVHTVVDDLAVEFTLAGPDKPVSFKINGTSGTSRSILACLGKLNFPADGSFDYNKIDIDMILKFKDIDINPFTKIAALYSEVSQINGLLNADIAVKGNLADGVRVKTDLSAIELEIPERNAEFGNIKIVLDGNITKTSADIKSAVISSKFCNVTASGKYGGSGNGVITAKAEMDIADTVDFLENMGVLTNDIDCAGKLQATIKGVSSGSFIKVKQADIKISNFDLDYQGKKLKQESLILSIPADINIAKREIKIPEAKLVASLGAVSLTSLIIGDWASVPSSIKAYVKSDIDIKSTREVLSDFVTFPENWGISGRLKIDLDIDFTAPESYNIKLNTTTSSLKIESTEPLLTIEDSPTLMVDMKTTPQFDMIDIRSAKLSSRILDMNISANFRNNNGESYLNMKGVLAPSMTELSRYLAAYSDIPVTFSGKKPEPFNFAANWSGEGDAVRINSMSGSAGLYADKIDGFGFHVRTLTVPVLFENNKAELKLTAKVNDGDLNFISSIDIGGKKPAIHIPDNLVILKDVNITTEVADELLGLINPVFHGVSTVEGKMSLLMNNFSWPVKKADMMSRVFAGKIIFNDVNLAANGLLTDLLDLAKVGTRELAVGDTSIDINCADGKITSSPLDLKVKEYELVLDGVVGLDNSLAYHAKVPMTETLVGKSGYKYLAGMSLDVPITGTVQKPILNLHSFESAVSRLVAGAATKALSGELEKQLNKLFK